MDIKIKSVRFIGTERNIGGVILRYSDEITPDDTAPALVAAPGGFRAPRSELDRLSNDYPAEFQFDYDKPKPEPKAEVPEAPKDEPAVVEPSPRAAKR